MLGGKLGLNKNIAEQEIIKSQAQAEAQKLKVLNSVRALFYQALAVQRKLEVRTRLAALIQDAVATAGQEGEAQQHADRVVELQRVPKRDGEWAGSGHDQISALGEGKGEGRVCHQLEGDRLRPLVVLDDDPGPMGGQRGREDRRGRQDVEAMLHSHGLIITD